MVGLIATIASLVDFGSKVVSRLVEYQNSMHDLPKIFKGHETNIPLIVDALKCIKIRAENGSVGEDSKRVLVQVINSCHTQIKSLDDILAKVMPLDTDTMLERGIKAALSISQEKEVARLMKQLKAHLAVLLLHSTAYPSSADSKKIVTKVLFTVPFERDSAYLDRPGVMQEIERMVSSESRVVIAGMGGVGKSQIAIEYCHRYHEQYPDAHVLWQHVSTFERALNGWSQMARQLKVPGCDESGADFLQLTKDYLSDKNHGRWLLVLDNADNADILFDMRAESSSGTYLAKNLVSSLPQSETGTIIVTTRDRRVGEKLLAKNKYKIIQLSLLTVEEALRLLRSRLSEDDWDEGNAKKLVSNLEFLPLAITQAAAFISQNSISIAEYLGFVQADEQEIKELLDEDLYDVRRDQDVQTTVLRTWKLSFDIIKKQKPRAVGILSLMACLDCNGIPIYLLESPGEKGLAFKMALGILQAFSMIRAETGGAMFAMHRLVQLST